jgi:two-component system response regulator AtoC
MNKEKSALPTVLVVDDEQNQIEAYKVFLEDHFRLLSAKNGDEAISKVKTEPINVVLLDILMPKMDGIQVLKKIKQLNDNVEVIMVTGLKSINTAILAIKSGAYDYVMKPFDNTEIIDKIKRIIEKQNLVKEVTYLRSEINKPFTIDNMIGKSQAIQQSLNVIGELAKTSATVIIYGESGTGKELVARAIHANSDRKNNPFIVVDCASIPENLFESELFGFEKGAFTDALTKKIGRFELANHGTIFFDEVGNIKPDIQSKILRVIQEKEIQRLGSIKTINLDLRIISATNIDLKKAVKEGSFREDLYYRLNVIPVFLPPLRDRKEDIPLLVDHFIKMFNKEFGKQIKGFTEEAMKFLTSYKWPGNIRELRNVMERLIVLVKDNIISHKKLPLDILMQNQPEPDQIEQKLILLKQARHQFEKEYIIGALEKNRWNQTKTAKFLGVHRNTLLLKIKELGIKEPTQ